MSADDQKHFCHFNHKEFQEGFILGVHYSYQPEWEWGTSRRNTNLVQTPESYIKGQLLFWVFPVKIIFGRTQFFLKTWGA